MKKYGSPATLVTCPIFFCPPGNDALFEIARATSGHATSIVLVCDILADVLLPCVAKGLSVVYGVNSPTRRIMENEALSSPARTEGRTPKAFALQGDPVDQDPDEQHTSDLVAVLKYSLRQAVTSHGVFSCIPFPSRNIEKRVAFSGIIYLSPNRQNGRQVCHQGHGCHKSR
ncbi:hypothetical protein AVEN_97030-1 [Araneus ventricosus]|uniref:Uncharacterized protein n=1 Tax=Araneus ventricosus TaxID=182803 RepID=A0A4Y2FG05_ARAVE|nr:hypothetical protein AVEN_97030-1 [Araneus ventricosus]